MKRKSAVSALLATKNKNIKLDTNIQVEGESSILSNPPPYAGGDAMEGYDNGEDGDAAVDDDDVSFPSMSGSRYPSERQSPAVVINGGRPPSRFNNEVGDYGSGQRSPALNSRSEELMSTSLVDMIKISKFTPTTENTVFPSSNENSIHGGSVIYGLTKGETLIFSGEYSLTVQKGAITLLGATLHASKRSYHVIAPYNNTHALPVIECIQVENVNLVELTVTEDNEHLIEKYKAVMRIDPKFTGLQNIIKIAPPFKNLWGTTLETGSGKPSTYHLVNESPSSTLLFTPFKSWYDIAYRIFALASEDSPDVNSPPIILILGPKSSGKSMFSKFLTNFFLSSTSSLSLPSRLHYLELDPGQPEYCPPGTISLHYPDFNLGPSFSHANFHNVIKAHSLGYTSPKDEPGLYLDGAHDLFRTYQETQLKNQTPLIINTPGWTRGLGVDLLADIASFMKPNVIISLGPEDSQMEVKAALSNCTDVPIFSVESVLDPINMNATSFYGKYSASDLRTLQTIAYLHSRDIGTGDSLQFHAQHLTEIPPYVVSYGTDKSESNSLTIQGIAITDSEGINIDDVALCINGSLVAVIAVDRDLEIPISRTRVESLPWIQPHDASSVLLPQTSTCLGYAVIQAIDVENRSLRLLTPISQNGLSRESYANNNQQLVLVRGRLHLPLWELWNPAIEEDAPYLSKNGPGSAAGSHSWRVRRNVLRRGFA